MGKSTIQHDFACYEEAYNLDPLDRDVCLKLYHLWPESDRPFSDWRQIVAHGLFRTSSKKSSDLTASQELIKGLVRVLVQLTLTDRSFKSTKFYLKCIALESTIVCSG